ncbi:digalactosyldiacylglycerol synthase 1, chloroplastic [Lactuca sativa]|uniref:digalactosyldiacylglycerol synthase 1, chloroplastic n=1 Tax=Lactuca sativa TaxID=4236 RepID=UPI000CBAD913|nr:digalactosyldiacylglycerol synthase 1, chloroplastic [Lactuca sativa]
MINFRPSESRTSTTSSSVTAEKAFSFISKGWREVKDSTEADLQLMKDRATSFKNLASSFDREFENFLTSASRSTFPVAAIANSSSPTPAEIDFVKNLQPKLSEFRRAYSSPDFSKKVLEKWSPRAKIRIDLSAIKNAIVSEVEEIDERERYRRRSRTRVGDFSWEWKGEGIGDAEEGQLSRNWEPIRALKTRLRELEQKSSSSEIIESLKNSELVEKVKSTLKAICKEPEYSKEVQPLDFQELLACLVRQSGPFLDHLGVKKDISDKIVESLCSKKKNQLSLRSFPTGESSILEGDNINDELDLRIASVLQSTGHHYEGGPWDDVSKQDGKRHVAIVTTASLPWMTGTAVNPLFRAAFLAKSQKQSVTLLVPWLTQTDQELVYPNNITFTSPEEQEVYIRNWLKERVGFNADFKISFYPGKFQKERRSIIPAGDTSKFISSKDADIAILEEPEHLNWYHHGKRWTDKFNHVVGVVHTNYLEYIKREKNGALQSFFVKHINNWVTRAYCDKVLRLSAATQDLPKSVVCNVHGVNPKFLEIGERMSAEKFSKGAYFLGKMVWAKGYRELIDLLSKQKNDLNGFKIDVYGNGEDANEVQTAAKKLELNVNFMKGRDHADDSLHSYKIFVNPSVSDVLCTATAEALAMGKFVICADHPSNEFFRSFPNCLTYKTPEEFVNKIREAMCSEPHPLTPEQRYNLSWEAATQRFMEFSDLDKILNNNNLEMEGGVRKSKSVPNLTSVVDGGLAFAHYCLTGNEFLRRCTGAVPGTRDYSMQHCKDLRLLAPHVENPIYGW